MRYKEIFKLKEMLEKAGIPHKFINWKTEWFRHEKWQITYPNVEPQNCICSCIEGFGTYGEEQDLLEIRGLLTEEEFENDSVLGHLTAEEVFERIEKHYKGESK